MRWAMALPQQLDDGAFDPEAFRTLLRRAEELGFESGWTVDQPVGSASTAGAIETMAFAAACTERLRLGCSVLVTPLRQPVQLAKSLASLDQLSRGRLEVGVGIGGRARPFAAFGVSGDGLVSRFTEGLQLMKELWTEPEVTHEGRFWQLDRVAVTPKPFQKPHPPIWFGGSARAAVTRAAQQADGFFGAGSTTTADFAQQVAILREELEHGGRDPAGFPVAKRVYVAVDDDAVRARDRMAAALVGIYGELGRRLEPAAVTGPPDACIDGLREVAAGGAALILLHPLFEPDAQLERLAAEVMPSVP